MEMIERDIWISPPALLPGWSRSAWSGANLFVSLVECARSVNKTSLQIVKLLRFFFHLVFIEVNRQVTVLAGADVRARTHRIQAKRADRPAG